MAVEKDLYEILGVSRDATDKEISKKYKALALKYHPDRNNGSEQEKQEAEEKFKEINEAYTILSDPEKRKQYDMFGTVDGRMQGGSPFGGSPFSGPFGGFDDVFDMFSGGARRQQQQQYRPGKNIQVHVKLDIEDIYCGCTKKIKYKRDVRCMTCHGEGGTDIKTCPHCHGTGIITKSTRNGFAVYTQQMPCPHCEGSGKTVGKVCPTCHGTGFRQEESVIEFSYPAGIQENQYVEIPEMGSEAKHKNGPNGVFIAIAKYAYDRNVYTISGLDIIHKIKINYIDALLGTTYKLVLPDKKELDVHIKECTEPGKKLILRGKGIKTKNHFGQEMAGDYYIEVCYEIPTSLSPEEKKLLEKLKKNKK